MNTLLPAINRWLFVAGFISFFTLAPPAVLAQDQCGCELAANRYFSYRIEDPAEALPRPRPVTDLVAYDPFAENISLPLPQDDFSTDTDDSLPAEDLDGNNIITGCMVTFSWSVPINIVFYQPNPPIDVVSRTLRRLESPRGFIIRPAKHDSFNYGTSIRKILETIHSFETSHRFQRQQYQVFAPAGNTSKTKKKHGRLLATVLADESSHTTLANLYLRAAQLEKNPTQRLEYLRTSVRYRER